jgi:hypothetical protein
MLRWDRDLLERIASVTPTNDREYTDTADLLLALVADMAPDLAKKLAGVGMTSTLISSAALQLHRATLDTFDRTALPYADRWRPNRIDEFITMSRERTEHSPKTSFRGRATAGAIFSSDGSPLSIRRGLLLTGLNFSMVLTNLAGLALVLFALQQRQWLAALVLVITLAVYDATSPMYLWVPLQCIGAVVFLPWSAVLVAVRTAVSVILMQITLQQRRIDSVNPNLSMGAVIRDMRVSRTMSFVRSRSIYPELDLEAGN